MKHAPVQELISEVLPVIPEFRRNGKRGRAMPWNIKGLEQEETYSAPLETEAATVSGRRALGDIDNSFSQTFIALLNTHRFL